LGGYAGAIHEERAWTQLPGREQLLTYKLSLAERAAAGVRERFESRKAVLNLKRKREYADGYEEFNH
jgi:hypothetical protein